MVLSVTASEAQRNFGQMHDDAMVEPVRVTKHGRETVYVISAKMWHELWASYRAARPVEEMSEDDIETMMNFEPSADSDYGADDYPHPD